MPEHLRTELREAADRGQRLPLIVAPPPELRRIPWAALPLQDPAKTAESIRLVEAADVIIGMPISLSVSHGLRAGYRAPTGQPLLVADPLGDLRYLRELNLPGARRLGWNDEAATRSAFLRRAQQAPLPCWSWPPPTRWSSRSGCGRS